MASKVIVGMPHGTFPQGKKREEVVTLGYLGCTATEPALRVQQLERNIRFLQEQHQIMLSGLHREVEVLRRRNRDLQFQMIFSKSGVSVMQNSPTSSPEEEAHRKIIVSPGQVNITPLQVELLERDIADLKTNLSEARTRNVYLQGVVDEQKKVIQSMESEAGEMAAVGKKMNMQNGRKLQEPEEAENTVEELQDKLDDADRMVRRLRRENEEQRKEIVSLRTTVAKTLAESRRHDGNYRHQRPIQHQHSQTSRFPPLHQQNQWNSSRSNGEYQKNSDRGGNRLGRDAETPGIGPGTLPQLRDRNNASTSSGFTNPTYNYQQNNHRRGYPHRGGARTYRNNHRDHQDHD